MSNRQTGMTLAKSALISGFIIVAAFMLRIILGNLLPLTWPAFVFDALTVATLLAVLFGVTRFVRDLFRWGMTHSEDLTEKETYADVTETERVAARMKSYTGAAVVVFILYWLFWLPGTVVNYVYYQEAKRMERIAGNSLPGVGCLSALLWLNVVGVAVALVGLLFLFARI